jgi:hypothetical protein
MGGLAYAFSLYYREKALEFAGKFTKSLLFILRFLASAILLLLLLSPMIKSSFSETEDPVVIFIQDNSESLAIADSVTVNEVYLKDYSKFIDDLGKSLDVRTFLTGSAIRAGEQPDFRDKESDLSSIVDVINAQFAGRNLAAVILASDGLYNKGSNPIYAYPEMQVPVHVIPMGDTVRKADIRISRVRNNSKTLYGNTFPVEVLVNADDCDGQVISLVIKKGDNSIRQEEIAVTGNSFSRSLIFYLNADEKGLQHYTAEIAGNGDDFSPFNNMKDFFIEVIDRREKVLILSGAPHPDLSFIRNTLESTLSYDVSLVDAFSYNGDPADHDLLIFHGLPKSGIKTDTWIQSLGNSGIPYFMILGRGSSVGLLDTDFISLRISDNNNNTVDVQPLLTDNFSLFELDKESFGPIRDYPPLIAPFGSYQPLKEVNDLLTQRIGQVTTEMPLLYFTDYRKSRVGVLTGEGIWKWALYEQREQLQTHLTSQLILKCVQYLLATGKNDPLNLYHKQSYHENENVIIDAELLNATGEFTNEPDMVLTLMNEDNEEFDFAFSRKSKGYTLNMGGFPPGIYKYRTSVDLGATLVTKSGQIRISPLQLEHNETKADHQLLRSIANRTKGKVYHPGQLGELSNDLVSNSELRPVTYSRSSLDDIINLWQIPAIIIMLLALEWVLRKRSGSY